VYILLFSALCVFQLCTLAEGRPWTLCVDGSLEGVQRFDLSGGDPKNSAASVRCASNAAQTEVAAVAGAVCYTGAANGADCHGSSTTCGDQHLSNLIAACCACNHIKGTNDWTDSNSPNYNNPPSSCSCAASGMASAPGGPAPAGSGKSSGPGPAAQTTLLSEGERGKSRGCTDGNTVQDSAMTQLIHVDYDGGDCNALANVFMAEEATESALLQTSQNKTDDLLDLLALSAKSSDKSGAGVGWDCG